MEERRDSLEGRLADCYWTARSAQRQRGTLRATRARQGHRSKFNIQRRSVERMFTFLPTLARVGPIAIMPAVLITRVKDVTPEGGVVELVVWRVPQPVAPATHL